MNHLLSFDEIEPRHLAQVGGKALNLATLMKGGVPVPRGVCLTTDAYEAFIEGTGLKTSIALELGRLPMAEMRWEEIWDMALRIRNLFLQAPMPQKLRAPLEKELEQIFSNDPVAVRSSSPQEDLPGASFAGLHDSFINLRGVHEILEHIPLVWASLWSDGALLYRKERGLSPETSTMAVIVQTLVAGERSGIAFSMGPDHPEQAVVESVYGLNQGLVDGTISPDRWTLDRKTRALINHFPAKREHALRSANQGTMLVPLSEDEKKRPPLSSHDLKRVVEMAMDVEKTFGKPQDVEWTIRGSTLFLLQSRPVTTHKGESEGDEPWSEDDRRPWYLSLKRSFENLKILSIRIENEILPQMDAVAKQLSTIALPPLSDAELMETIQRRSRIHQHWVDIYWRDLIPFAHGVRLFGQVYNDTIKPGDPYEFTDLLRDTSLTALERNRDLQALAEMIHADAPLQQQLATGTTSGLDPDFSKGLDTFLKKYEDMTFKAHRFFQDRNGLIGFLLELASQKGPNTPPVSQRKKALTTAFIHSFPPQRHDFARDILKIGRASYRLRDNDNIILSRIEAQLIKAVEEGRRRFSGRVSPQIKTISTDQVLRLFSDPAYRIHQNEGLGDVDEPVSQPQGVKSPPEPLLSIKGVGSLQARQLIGQPAGQGLAEGRARVIRTAEDLFGFKAGEILVCDAVDPNMTFVVPLASAIVEQRGGMLVHGAIIAREYGLPCITGVADATRLMETGHRLTVDGYLGIVTIHMAPSTPDREASGGPAGG